MRKRILTALVAVVMAVFMSMTSFAGVWLQDSVGWWWRNDDGSYPVSSWQWLDGNGDGVAECYYFNEVGYMLANTTTPDGYQVNADGAWIVDNIVQYQYQNSQNATEQAVPATDADSSDNTYGIAFPSSGQTLYDGKRSFYVTSVRMDIIDDLKSVEKYKVTYQIEGELYGDNAVYAHFDSYSANGTLLDHRIVKLDRDGVNAGDIHIPYGTVRVELVSDDVPKTSSSRGNSSSSRSGYSSSQSNSSGGSSVSSSQSNDENYSSGNPVGKLTDYIRERGSSESSSVKVIRETTRLNGGAKGSCWLAYHMNDESIIFHMDLDKGNDYSLYVEFSYDTEAQDAENGTLYFSYSPWEAMASVSTEADFDIGSFAKDTTLDFTVTSSFGDVTQFDYEEIGNEAVQSAMLGWQSLCAKAGVTLNDLGFSSY